MKTQDKITSNQLQYTTLYWP